MTILFKNWQNPNNKGFLKLLLLLVLAIAAHYPAINAGIFIDDREMFINDPVIAMSNGLYQIWFQPLEQSTAWPYIPVTRSLFWLEYQIFGLNLQVSHAINIILHFCNALLLWLVLRKFQIPGAWLVGAIFLLHPLSVQSVAWLIERKNLVPGIFFILTVWSYSNFVEKKHWYWYGITIGLFICALLSKTSTVMLPVILIFCHVWLRHPWHLRNIFFILPFFALSFIVGFTRVWFELHLYGASGTFFEAYDLSILERFIVAGHIPFFYLSKIFFPYPLLFIYPKWEMDFISFSKVLPLISVLLTACVVIWKYQPWGRPLFLGLGAFLVMLFPVLGFFNNAWLQFSFVSDHWVYLATISIFLLIVQGWFWVENKMNQWPSISNKIKGAGIGLMVGLAFLTWNQTRVYKNPETLWTATLEKNPESWIANQKVGVFNMENHQYDQALQRFNKVLEKKDHSKEYFNRGNAYFALNQYRDALKDFNRAIKKAPGLAHYYNNRGAVYEKLEDYRKAIDDYTTAIALQPGTAEYSYNRGMIYVQLQQFEDAIEDYTQAITLNTDNSEYYNSRGLAYKHLNQYDRAFSDYAQALTVNPQNADAYKNRGVLHSVLAQYDKAIEDYNRALQIDPRLLVAYYNRAYTYIKLQNIQRAIQDFDEILKISPQDSNALNQRGYFHRILGNLQAACSDWKLACQMEHCENYEKALRKEECRK